MSFDGYAFVGLNERAKKLVAGEQRPVCVEKVTRIFPDGRSEELPDRVVFESTVKTEEIDRIKNDPWLDHPLMRYTMPDGRVYFEGVQQRGVSDSYGFILLALQDEQGDWVTESRSSKGEVSKLMIDLMDDQTMIGKDGEYWVVAAREAEPEFVTHDEHAERMASARRAQVVGDKVIVDGLEKSIDDYEFLGLYRRGEIAPGVQPESEETEDVNVSEFE